MTGQGEAAVSKCFGFDRQLDEDSLKVFLRLFSNRRLLDRLVPRLSDQELMEIVDQLTLLMRRHLSKQEYHALFLGEEDDSASLGDSLEKTVG